MLSAIRGVERCTLEAPSCRPFRPTEHVSVAAMPWYAILAVSLLIWLVVAVVLALVLGRVVRANRGAG